MAATFSDFIGSICSDLGYEITLVGDTATISGFNENHKLIFGNYSCENNFDCYCGLKIMINVGDHAITWNVTDIGTLKAAVEIVDKLDNNESNIRDVEMSIGGGGNAYWSLDYIAGADMGKLYISISGVGGDIDVTIPILHADIVEYLRMIAVAYKINKELEKYNTS